MVRCSRRSDDPLLNHFLKRRVNLLDPPRMSLPLGTVFISRGSDVYDMPLADLVDGPVVVEALPGTGTIAERKEILSNGLAVDSGASLSGAILSALGIGVSEPAISASLKAMGAHRIMVSLVELSVSRLSRVSLQKSFADCLIRTDQFHADGKHKYYVTIGTWSAREMDFRIEGKDGRSLEASSEMEGIFHGDGKLDVRKGSLSQTLIRSPYPLVFGVELMRIGRDGDGLTLVEDRPRDRMRGDGDEESLVLLGDEEAFFSSGPDGVGRGLG